MKRSRIWYGVLLAATGILYIMADRDAALGLLICLIVVPLLSLLIQWFAVKELHIECQIRKGCLAGEEQEFEIWLYRESSLPLGAVESQVESENIHYGERKLRKIRLQPSEKRKMKFVYPCIFDDCGNVRISVSNIRCYDLLGLFALEKKMNYEGMILVYPSVPKMSVSLQRKPETLYSGDRYDPYKKGQDISEMANLRGYVEGDAFNHIHWKMSSKLDKLMVREFAFPSNYNTVILSDMMKCADGKEISNQCNNAVAAFTAGLSECMLQQSQKHEVGYVLKGEYRGMPVDSTESQEQLMLSLLSRPVEKEKNRAEAVYSFLRGNLKNNYTKMIYITPAYDEDFVRQLAKEIDITILHIVSGKEVLHADISQGYSIIPVNADRYMEQSYNLIV